MFNSPQIRKRLYITGVRTDVPCLRRFKMPTGSNGRPKSLASLVASSTSGEQVKDWELTYTELRNWTGIKCQLKDRTDVKFPVIGDFQQSKAFGISWQGRKSMTITKSRAQPTAFWIIDSPGMAWGFQEGGSRSVTTPSLWDGTTNPRHSTSASISSIAPGMPTNHFQRA